jgi:hypothetical protein
MRRFLANEGGFSVLELVVGLVLLAAIGAADHI